jgi:hypothetical protein
MRPVREKNTEGNLGTLHAGNDNGGSSANSENTSSAGVLSNSYVRSRQPFEPSASVGQPHTITQSNSLDTSLYPHDWQMDTVSSGPYQQPSVRQSSVCVDSLNLTLDEATHLHHARTTDWSVTNAGSPIGSASQIEAPM